MKTLARQQLSPADRELFDLRYLDPTDLDTFARNELTGLFTPEDTHARRPLVTIYAAPHEPADVRLPRLLTRLQDAGLKSWLPPSPLGPLVPGLYRTLSGGVVAHDGNRDLSRLQHAFVLRTSGSVELLDGNLTATLRDESAVFLRATLIRTAQVLSYILAFGEQIARDAWTLLVNVRDAQGAKLLDPHDRFRDSVTTAPRQCLERHVQFRRSLRPADKGERAEAIDRFDEILAFAFGYTEARGQSRSGELTEW